MKYLSLDIGEKRIGVAVSDDTGILARPLLNLETSRDLIHRLGEIVHEEKPDKVIIGIPRHMSGEEAESAGQIREFAKGLKHEYNIEVDFEDEFGTSLEAEKRLRDRGFDHKKIKEMVDAEAATVILESYLARTRHNT